jgi:hypothetical protein
MNVADLEGTDTILVREVNGSPFGFSAGSKMR